MPEPQADVSAVEEPTRDSTSDELARSLGSAWQRFSGQRPKSTNVEIEKDVVRCVIEESTTASGADEDGSDDASHDSRRLDSDATAAVVRVTGRRVIALIPKHDEKAQTYTQRFILDRPRQRL